MADQDYKKYTENARRGIKGEAFFESLIVDYAIPHRIARQNDLGVDFLCEWIAGYRSTGILFLAQVKSTTDGSVKVEPLGSLDYNNCEIYELKGATGIAKVDERTLKYWKGIGLPAYMFIIIESKANGASNLDCYYKRYTPLLAGHESDDDKDATKMFHKANDGARFLPFSDLKNKIGGFARDLIIDYVRLSYSKGHIIPLIPDQLGFWPFPKKYMPNAMFVFSDIAEWHKDKIKATCDLTNELLSNINKRQSP